MACCVRLPFQEDGAVKIQGSAGRASWTLVDQVVSSLSNGLLSVLIARSVDETAFGGFALAFTIFTLLIGVTRAVGTSPLGIRFTDASTNDFASATAAATGTALSFGVVGGIGCLVAGGLIGNAVGPALIALGVIFPGLILQDAWRQVFFAAGRPAAAALIDTIWAIVELAAVSALLVAEMGTATSLILAWGFSAMAAALLGARQARTWPRPWRTFGWLRDHRDLTGYMGVEFATMQGTYQAVLLSIGTIGSLEVIGALRGVQVLLAPTAVMAITAFNFAVPEFSRRRSAVTERQWVTGALSLSGFLSLLGLCWGIIFVLLPYDVGRALLGDTWAATSGILWVSVMGQVGAALGVGPAAMLYAMGRARVTLGVHIVLAPLVLIGGTGGVLLNGAHGAAWGLCLANWAVVPLWAYRLHRETIQSETDRIPGNSDCAEIQANSPSGK
jgi:O-antigen/teichoic acid export membrane protein